MSLRIGPGPPGVLAAVAAGDPKSGVLASSSSPLLHTGSTEIKEGGEEKCHGCKKIAEEETDEGDVDGEDLHRAGKTLPGRAAVALGTNIETIMVTIMVLLNSQCNIISSTFSCQSSSYSVELGVDPDFYFPFV